MEEKGRAGAGERAPIQPGLERRGLAEWARRARIYGMASAGLLLPCWWHSRMEAGDLSSHIYNAWLAQLIERGQAPGLVLAHQTTNVLFDWLLGGLFGLFGAAPAQRLAVSAAVLVFVWGAFALVCAWGRRRAWYLLPCLGMLAYGHVFRMGFFNFYMSLGLCFWALALGWKPAPLRLAGAAAILAIAYVAHALPVAWAACVFAYLLVAGRLRPRYRPTLVLGCIVVLAGLRWLLVSNFRTGWLPTQVFNVTGADQLLVWGVEYAAVGAVLLLLWGWLVARLFAATGAARLCLGAPAQVCLLTALGVAVLPRMIALPMYKTPLHFIPDRMSLAVGVLVCALLAGLRPRAWESAAVSALAALFFAMVWADEGRLNLAEDRIEAAVATLPPGARVVGRLRDSRLRSPQYVHMIDRVCVGRCYSYANYEPSTAQFRVRALHQNPIVTARARDSAAMQNGNYMPAASELPMYVVFPCRTGDFCVETLTGRGHVLLK